jgi:hypothetical protein
VELMPLAGEPSVALVLLPCDPSAPASVWPSLAASWRIVSRANSVAVEHLPASVAQGVERLIVEELHRFLFGWRLLPVALAVLVSVVYPPPFLCLPYASHLWFPLLVDGSFWAIALASCLVFLRIADNLGFFGAF